MEKSDKSGSCRNQMQRRLSMHDDIHCYAQRLLNPFRGVMNCIRYQSAEAVTMDGVHWDIYVANDALKQNLESDRAIQISDIRYGHWSAETGLKRGPIFPSEEFKRLEHMGATVYEYLLDVCHTVPFCFRDVYELWLLDTKDHPLALLNSAVYAHDMANDQILDWRPGLACRQEFVSSVNERLPLSETGHQSAGEYLCWYVNRRAGMVPRAQWFERSAENSTGLAGINLDAAMQGRVLANEEFSESDISLLEHDECHSRLIDEFINWQAPWWLLLESLTSEQRYLFEQQARKRALEVERQYRLYPDIVDNAAIKAARVEAVLRKSLPSRNEVEQVVSTYYIEISDNPGRGT